MASSIPYIGAPVGLKALLPSFVIMGNIQFANYKLESPILPLPPGQKELKTAFEIDQALFIIGHKLAQFSLNRVPDIAM
jgi:hypothetical protein